MGKKKTIRHMGMVLSEEEHRRWHEQHDGKELTPREHRRLREHLGVSEGQDRQWHEAQTGSLERVPASGEQTQAVNGFAIGGEFLEYCVRQGWLMKQRQGRATRYYLTGTGREGLAGFGITQY